MAMNVSDTVFTTTEASTYLGLSEHTVRKYIERGLIKAKKVGTLNLVTKTECDRYRREKRPRGNPNLSKSA
jgi:excisionase family DNA binding protein